MSQYRQIISQFKGKRILVIGDVLLDQHIRGSVSRISPEAPVPIVLQEEDPAFAPGGAANVANNLKSLGAFAMLVGRIGADEEGKILKRELKKRQIPTEGLFIDKNIPTIIKTRIIAQHQQMLRLDREKIIPLEGKLLKDFLDYIHKDISSYDAVIISDYGKGTIGQLLVSEVCSLALKKKKIIAVDPKVGHFSYYRGVTAITPNKKETENAIRNIKITHTGAKTLDVNTDQLNTIEDIKRAGGQILRFLDLESLLITLGEQGMCLFEKGKKSIHIHTKAKEVFDVTGAGDTVIAVFTLGLTTGASKIEAADLANYAAGIVVGKMGAVAVTPAELLQATKVKD